MLKLSRILSLLIAAAFVTSLLFGCASSNGGQSSKSATVSQSNSQKESTPESTKTEKQPVTLKWLGTAFTSYLDKAIPEDPVAQELTKKTGVTLDWSLDIGVADTNTKLSVLLASGDLPDIVVPVNNPDLNKKLLESKSVIPLDDLIKTNGADIIKNAPKMVAYNKLAKSDDTHSLYCISAGVRASNFNTPLNTVDEMWNIRWDLYKKLGYPSINNLDEFLNALKGMQKLEPKNEEGKSTYGLGLFLAESWGEGMVDRAHMFCKGFSNIGSATAIYINTNTNKVVPRLSDPNSVYWQSLKFYNDAYRAGVLDPESATLKFQTYMDKAKANRYLAGIHYWTISAGDATFAAANEEKGFLPVLVDPNPEGIWAVSNVESGNLDIYVSKNCKTPDRAVDLLNYLATYEGSELLNNGVENVDWQMIDGVPQLIGNALETVKAGKQGDLDYIKKSGIQKYSWQMAIIGDPKDPRGFSSKFSDNTKVLLDIANSPEERSKRAINKLYDDYVQHYNIKNVVDNFTKFPKYEYDYSYQSALTTDPTTEIGQMNNDINTYVQTHVAKVIFQKTEEGFNSEKAKFIADVNTMGADKVVAYFADFYEKYMQQLNSMTVK
jgi:ABC-type sugar transport system, periplasmic component